MPISNPSGVHESGTDEGAKFGEPEIRFSEAGPAMVMPWIMGFSVRGWLDFGDLMDAETALELGMINKIVPAAELADYTLKYACRLSLVDPDPLVAGKQAITRGADTGGFHHVMMVGLDAVAPPYPATTESSTKSVEIARNQDLRAALAWRNGQVAEYIR